jgi:hypothetical protein
VKQYGKAIAATLGAVAMSLYVALTDNHVTTLEWVLAGQAWIGAAGVYLVPLAPQYRWGKTAVAALFAGSEVLVLAIPGGVTGHEWLGIVIAIGAASGVAGLHSVSANGVSSRAPAQAAAGSRTVRYPD